MKSIHALEIERPVTGYHQMTSLDTAEPCRGYGSMVDIQAEGDDLRYRPDGVDPTATVGFLILEGETHRVHVGEGKIQDIRIIQATTGGIANVISYK